MGTHLAKLPQPYELPPHVKPQLGELPWIVYHAACCGMSPVEVHRLWARFRQLGATSDGTVIAKGAKINEYFANKILLYLANTKGEVPFANFLCAVLWWSRCDVEDKLGVIFYLMNENYPMNQLKLKEVLQKIHPDWDEYKIGDLVGTTFQEVDLNHDGLIDLQEFKNWHLAHLEATARLLDFAILSPEVKVMDDQMPICRMMAEQNMFNKMQVEIAKSASSSGSSGTVSTGGQSVKTVPPPIRGEPCGNHILRAVAERLVGRDWWLLVNRLNFTVADVDTIASLCKPGPDQELQKVLTVLKTWRDRERHFATPEALEQALILSRFSDIAADLRSL